MLALAYEAQVLRHDTKKPQAGKEPSLWRAIGLSGLFAMRVTDTYQAYLPGNTATPLQPLGVKRHVVFHEGRNKVVTVVVTFVAAQR